MGCRCGMGERTSHLGGGAQQKTSFKLGGGSRPPSAKVFVLGGGSRPPSAKSSELGGGSAPACFDPHRPARARDVREQHSADVAR